MMNAVVQIKLHIRDRWKLKHAAKINDFSQLLAIQFGKPRKISFERLRVPLRDPRGITHGVRPVIGGEIKLAGDNAIPDPGFRGDDMPGQLECRLRNGVGPVLAFISRNSLDNLLGDAVLIFQGRQRKIVEEYRCLLRLQRFHILSPPNSPELYSTEKIAVSPAIQAFSKLLLPARLKLIQQQFQTIILSTPVL